VLRAASAEAALQMAPRQPLGLITLDLQLPGVDGWDLLLRLRENSALARVPVVIFDGLADSKPRLTGGAAAILQKPVSRLELKTALARLGLHPADDKVRTLLVVDDDPKAVEVIASFLTGSAYSLVRAYGGSEAISLARKLLPELILLDLMMPDVSGFEVVAALRRDPTTARIPVLVITAKQVSEQDRAALLLKSDTIIHVVEKSGFDQSRFIAEVRQALLSH